eukprot:scaffold28030_cov72-Phaeocystis_antarctica.AAC.6
MESCLSCTGADIYTAVRCADVDSQRKPRRTRRRQPRAGGLVQAASCAGLRASDLMLGSSRGVRRLPSTSDGAGAPRVGSMLRIEIGQGLCFRAVEMTHTRCVVAVVVQVGAPLAECGGAAQRGIVVDHGRA